MLKRQSTWLQDNDYDKSFYVISILWSSQIGYWKRFFFWCGVIWMDSYLNRYEICTTQLFYVSAAIAHLWDIQFQLSIFNNSNGNQSDWFIRVLFSILWMEVSHFIHKYKIIHVLYLKIFSERAASGKNGIHLQNNRKNTRISRPVWFLFKFFQFCWHYIIFS